MKKILITGCSSGFGFQALNDAVEPIRKVGLESMGLADCDGPPRLVKNQSLN
jgi:hypothetical protein